MKQFSAQVGGNEYLLLIHIGLQKNKSPCEILRMGIILSEFWLWLKNSMMTLDRKQIN